MDLSCYLSFATFPRLKIFPVLLNPYLCSRNMVMLCVISFVSPGLVKRNCCAYVQRLVEFKSLSEVYILKNQPSGALCSGINECAVIPRVVMPFSYVCHGVM